jgi:two-component system phosphate regulon response regulator PhoB
MPKDKILIIEDDEDIQELIRYNLAREGYGIETVVSAEEGLALASSWRPDLILLDLMLPGIDGLEACKKFKNSNATAAIPIIMVTAKGEETDVVAGLELGADDYIVKPFSPKVLVARIRNVLRRADAGAAGSDEAVIDRKGIHIHPGQRKVTAGGVPLELTFTEFNILEYLARRPGWVFTRSQIVDSVRGSDYYVTERSVDVHILGLRKKLGDFGDVIETVRGVGYRFKE